VPDSKYGHLIKGLDFREGRGGANAREIVFVQGSDIQGFELNFMLGVYEQTGDWAPGHGAHIHPFDELILFFGYTEDLSYLGSDMELCLGKEREKHKFSAPTVAVVAKGLPHNPLVTEKVYKPFGHFHLALSAKYSGSPVPQEGQTDGNKYTHLVKKMPVIKGPGGADAKQLISMSGDQLEGLNINFTMGLFNGTGQWQSEQGKRAHSHPYNECMVFFGTDSSELKHLGAEIIVDIGQEHERHALTVPSVIALPKGLPHSPIVCNRADRAYGVMQVGLNPQYRRQMVD
jgi:hypothetical protein